MKAIWIEKRDKMFSIYRLFARIFPRNIKKDTIKLLEYSNIDVEINRFLGFQLTFSLLLSAAVAVYLLLFFNYSFWIVLAASFASMQTFIYLYLVFSAEKKGSFTDSILPDALQLMASNLRTGITIEKALFMAARPEFGPFKKELDRVGKEIAMGKDITMALRDLSSRIKSEKLEKTIYLIISGIKSGGELAQLLERTAQDLRDQEIMDKKIRASIGMYKIFIFIAIGFAAPFLFSLSSMVVEILSKTFSEISIPKGGAIPLSLSSVSISIDFIKIFSLVFIITSCILGSLVLGLISKGRKKDGAKYIIPLVILSVAIFFVIRFAMTMLLGGVFGI
ncbi:MAG TPA: type II secretion system F family protein [Candidatus Nanoarchaeia archaeon]|nr:type II secretion system F family protein [Candidatus Nanoarchaeia archaeon]